MGFFIYALPMRDDRSSLPLVVITFGNMSLLGFLNSMRGVSFPLIRNSFNASYSSMGLMSALCSFGAVCFCIIAGVYMNRFGLKRTMVSAFFIIILGAGSLFFASGFFMVVMLFMIMQSGFSFFEISLNGTGVRLFTKKSALMLNLLHFFYGVGAIGGPRFMGFMVNRFSMSWNHVYTLALVAVFIMLGITLAIRFPGGGFPEPALSEPVRPAETPQEKPSFWSALKDPMVWLFGVILGVSGSIESCSVSWSGLYLQDVYGLDPSSTGAVFVSVFFILYTVSRFCSGFIIEKIGYLRSVIVSGAAIVLLFVFAFVLGRKGIYLLPVVGFFVAVMWPTVLAISVGIFRERAQTVSSAMISIAFTVSGIISYSFGLSNRFIGAAWGYRSCVLFSLVLTALLLFLKRRITLAKGNS